MKRRRERRQQKNSKEATADTHGDRAILDIDTYTKNRWTDASPELRVLQRLLSGVSTPQ